jgi:hypothetical protein
MRNTKRALHGTAVLIAALMMCVAVSASPDAHSGTWKLNAEKSKYSPGPAPKSITLIIESDENGLKVDSTALDAEGKATHVQFDAKYDGKDYPVTGLANADMVSAKRINANTIETTQKKDGKVVMTVTSKVSKDGKTRTTTFVGKDAQGHAVHNVVV